MSTEGAQKEDDKPGALSAAPANDRADVAAARGEPSLPGGGTYFLGRYRIVDEIGIGGMASVHLARADGPGGFQKWVAIKRIHPHLAEDAAFIQMFLDEARIAARISHPNVAQVFDLGTHKDTYWIAMEYLHGEPLREIMRGVEESRVARIEPELAAKIVSDAAEGLHAAHELRDKDGRLLNLVHRDVSPHNLFLTYDGAVKVVDFGIAKVAGRLSTTRAGTLKGKLAYMSPEQVRGAVIDRRTDVFALGVVLWELTTGRRLFRMDTDLETLERVQACVVPAPSSVVEGYPAELEAVVLRALARDANQRFATARELSRNLQQYLMHMESFVGSDEIGAYVRDALIDRYQKREAHLRWAAEVTRTIPVDQLERLERPSSDVDEVSILTHSAKLEELLGPRDVVTATGSSAEIDVLALASPPRPAPPVAAPAPPRPPPEPPLPAFELLSSSGVATAPAHHVYSEDDNAPTNVLASQAISAIHAPAKSARPAPQPDENIVIAQADSSSWRVFDPASRTAAQRGDAAAQRPVWLRDSRLILIGITAAATTMIALALTTLVVLQLTARSEPEAAAPARLPGPAAPAEHTQSPEATRADQPVDPSSLPTEDALERSGGASGFLTIVCEPGCESVQADGTRLGPSPVVRAPLAPGGHAVVLQRAGLPEKTIRVTIVSGQTTAQRVKLGT